jgi:hypothetical protein
LNGSDGADGFNQEEVPNVREPFGSHFVVLQYAQMTLNGCRLLLLWLLWLLWLLLLQWLLWLPRSADSDSEAVLRWLKAAEEDGIRF